MEGLHELHDLMNDPEADPEAFSKSVSLVEAALYIMQVKLFLKLNFHFCLIPLSQLSAGSQTGKDSSSPMPSLVLDPSDSEDDSEDNLSDAEDEVDLGAWRAGGGHEKLTEDDQEMVNVHSLTCHPVG